VNDDPLGKLPEGATIYPVFPDFAYEVKGYFSDQVFVVPREVTHAIISSRRAGLQGEPADRPAAASKAAQLVESTRRLLSSKVGMLRALPQSGFTPISAAATCFV
jgi:hypothetical protein